MNGEKPKRDFMKMIKESDINMVFAEDVFIGGDVSGSKKEPVLKTSLITLNFFEKNRDKVVARVAIPTSNAEDLLRNLTEIITKIKEVMKSKDWEAFSEQAKKGVK